MWSSHSGAGHWPDADMLPIGAILQDYSKDNRTAFTKDEQVTMMNLWCIMRSPLMIGGDMVYNDDFTYSLLSNADLLEMLSQARYSKQVYRRRFDKREQIVWSAVRKDGGYYLAVFNAGEEQDEITVNLSELELDGEFELFNIWTKTTEKVNGTVSVSLAPHASAAFRLSR